MSLTLSIVHKQYITLYIPLISFLLNPIIHAQRTIILDPAGNTRTPSRMVMGVPESHMTLLLTNAMQELFKKQYPHITVIITRRPGQHVDEITKAQLANKTAPDLYIRLLLYESLDIIPKWYIYQHTNYAITKKSLTDFAFYPYDQAFMMTYDKTQQLNVKLIQLLSIDTYLPLWRVIGPVILPIEGIQGIIAPTIICELGISAQHHWKNAIEPLTKAIAQLLS